MAKKPTAPRGLGTRGRKFWREQVAEHEFSVAEQFLLAEACRCLDRLDGLEHEIATEGVMATGSMGQAVANPALQEARQQQVTFLRLVGSLGLDEKAAAQASAVKDPPKRDIPKSGVRGRFQVISNAG